MKKAILILVAGLLLSGCAYQPFIMDRNNIEGRFMVTEDVAANSTFEEIKLVADNKCKLLGRGVAIDISRNNVIDRDIYKDYPFSCEKGPAGSISTTDITFTINDKKEQCEAIGFTPQTDKFADCVLRLVELDVKSQQQAQIQLALSQGNQQVADELRAQRNQQNGQYLMDLGQKLLNPSTRKTTRCTVTGFGNFKTVSCR